VRFACREQGSDAVVPKLRNPKSRRLIRLIRLIDSIGPLDTLAKFRDQPRRNVTDSPTTGARRIEDGQRDVDQPGLTSPVSQAIITSCARSPSLVNSRLMWVLAVAAEM
jgi:hypothetical protein